MITLGGRTLDPNLQIPDFNSAVTVAGSERRTLGGRVVVQRYGQSGIYQLTAVLDGNRLYGKFTTDDVKAIRAMAELGDPVPLSYNGTDFDVVIPLDGINLTPYGNRTDPPADHPHYGAVTLYRS